MRSSAQALFAAQDMDDFIKCIKLAYDRRNDFGRQSESQSRSNKFNGNRSIRQTGNYNDNNNNDYDHVKTIGGIHENHAHVSNKVLKKSVELNLLRLDGDGQLSFSEEEDCESCCLGKSHSKLHLRGSTGEYVVKTAEAVEKHLSMIETTYGTHIQFLHSDRGTEYLNQDVSQSLKNHHCILLTTSGYDSAANGQAERTIETLTGNIRTNLIASGLPHQYWEYALLYSVAVRNKLYRESIDTSPDFYVARSFWNIDNPNC
ncbi:unnamed protein product [Ambrosiozyma monospora]|uniref:Unnamed protein product n=1 Tax=Ambrosiozyma monospora TaxID=43982 RepID=A0A9W6YWM0_AMBMO|nr:unnamed protein product [Ambrosiozyma monospora]